MKSKALWWAVPIGTVLALVMVSAALAQKTKCKEFQGVITLLQLVQGTDGTAGA